MKKISAFTLALFLCMTININGFTYAREYPGKIDFYKVFSKNNENIDRIGNKIYNWSIYLPSDAVISKNPKATSFDMYTNSFKSNVTVNVFKNIHNLTLEEIYVNMLESSGYVYPEYGNSYRCSAEIQKERDGNKYIIISSISPEYFEYKVSDNSDEETGTYSEQRVYLGKNNTINYIYTVDISMDLEYYKHHKNLFLKIADSFKTSFDTSNPNIKNLSDLVTSYRIHENKIYGWKIELAPYWKLQGNDTSITQLFMPLYSDEEIGQDNQSGSDMDTSSDSNPLDTTEPGQDNPSVQETIVSSSPGQDNSSSKAITESLNVSVISSIPQGQSFDLWSDEEMKSLQSNYNQNLFSTLSEVQNINMPDAKAKLLVLKIKNSNKDSMIIGTMLVQGHEYRYKIVLEIPESKFNERAGKDAFFRTIKSFGLTKSKSKFVQELIPVESVLDYNAPKIISLKQYNLKINANNRWSKPFSIFDGQIEEYTYPGYSDYYDDSYNYGDSSYETLTLNHLKSGTALTIDASVSSQPFDQVLHQLLYGKITNPEINSKVINLNANKSEFGDITVYKIVETYNIGKMEELFQSDNRITYNYTTLSNTYTYIFQAGEDLYNLSFSIPLINCSAENIKIIEELWKRVIVDEKEIGIGTSNWEPVDLEKYKNPPEE